jgi:hypothetical protein
MTSANRNQKTIKTGTGRVIPFRQPDLAATSEEYFDTPTNPLSDPEVEERLKSIVEAAVIEGWMKTRLLDIEKIDDPFDAIYISELRPDRISNIEIGRITKYSNIEDLSDTISFDDEWED